MKIFKNFIPALLLVGLVFVSGCGRVLDHTDASSPPTPSPTIAPIVLSTVPAKDATDVALNSNIVASFSDDMDPATITSESFVLKESLTTVASVITCIGKVGTLNPSNNLLANTVYTATLTTAIKNVAGDSLTTSKTWSFTTGVAIDATAPTVLSTVPANGVNGTAINSNITATFSEPMNAATITSTSFTLKQGATPITATVTYAGNIGTLNPDSNLLNSKVYTAEITTFVSDLAGNNLVATKNWSFTTAVAADTTAPTVLSTLPAHGATGIAIASNLTANFSEAMNAATITSVSFTLKQGITPIAANVTYVGTSGILNPASNLAYSTVYTASITTAVKDTAGNALATTKTWSFTTVAAPDTTAPTVLSTLPAHGATGIYIDSNVTANFSEAMNASTITALSFTLKQGATPITATVAYIGNVGTLNPDNDLLANTVYTAEIATTVKDVAGNSLVVTKNWTFTTAIADMPLAVNLRTAGDFAVISKAGISADGGNSIVGDIGVSPIGATAITGFGLTMDSSGTFSASSLVTGKVYAADYTAPTPTKMTTAIGDIETAFTDAAGRTNPTATELGAGDIGGLTIPKGLYKWGTALLIPTDVTLAGSSTDVWIFQIAGNLILSSGAKILLTGGAKPENIFWQVEGSTILNTTAHLEGIILCKTLISMKTSSTIKGRMLAQTAITLGTGATVTKP
ncbi:MAG: Ig-like domain-containing protein [Candidatus Margulisbacteria bacterium]|nr:Ig-like domain-containing protein [Candidatus Margulisiibacteriota bacterium]